MKRHKEKQSRPNIVNGMLLLVVGFSWILLYLLFSFEAVMLLAPWDTAVTRPDVGTWARMLNDFFELGGGAQLLALLLVGVSAWRVIWTRQRTNGRLFQILLTNLALFFAMPLLLTMVFMFVYTFIFPYPDVPYDPAYPGYHLTILPLITASIMIFVWLRVQKHIMRHNQHMKRKRGMSDHDQVSAALRRLTEQPQSARETLPVDAEQQRRVIT